MISILLEQKKVCFEFRKTKPVITKVKRRVITCVVVAANILILKPNNLKFIVNQACLGPACVKIFNILYNSI